MNKSLELNYKFNYFIIVFTLLFGVVFYDVIDELGFSYTDEILVLILFLYFLAVNISNVKKEFIFFLFIAVFYLMYSLYSPHNVLPAILTDFFVQIKPYIAFYTVYSINFAITEKKRKQLITLCKVCAIVLLPIGILNPGGGEIMDHFGGYSRYATIMIVLGTTYLVYSEQQKKDLIITLIIYSIGLLSLRSKMFGFYVAFLCIMFLWEKVSVKRLLSFKSLILFSIMMLAIFYVAKEKIIFYFVEGSQADDIFARPLLYISAIEILKDFPFFGTGFGSYATFASAEYYSPLYYDYDLYLSPEIGNGLFISDTFFPVFAQFGYIGFFLFICFWIRRFKTAKVNYKMYKNLLFFKLSILIGIFFFIESVADSTFTHNRGIAMLMLLAIILNNRYNYYHT